MFDFHEKRKIRTLVYSKLVIVLICIASVLLINSVYHRYVVAEEMRLKLEDKRVELEDLEHRAQALESRVKYLENERGVEEELRNRFDVVKEGEQMVIFLDDREGENVPQVATIPTVSNNDEDSSFLDFLKFWRSED